MPPDLSTSLILQAYARGIFPMSEARDDDGLFWVDPEMRGVIPLDGFHVSRSLRKTLMREAYEVRINSDFAGVIKACADREETWINDNIFEIYMDLFNEGYAQSVEVWDGDDLIGGVYGVTLQAAFFGESMFSRKTDASKIALAYLVHRLNAGGFKLFDTQFLTEHLASLGGIEVTRLTYQRALKAALLVEANFHQLPLKVSAHQVCTELPRHHNAGDPVR